MKLIFQGAISFIFFGGTKLLAETNSETALQLSPPYGELPPPFWQQNERAIFISVFTVLILAAFALWLFLRAKPKKIIPPEILARENLEKMRPLPENGEVISRVSQTLQNYFIAAFQLPAGQFTTAEFSRAISNHSEIGEEISSQTVDFLRECDARKFSLANAGAPLKAADRALNLVELAEQRRAQLRQLAETQKQGQRA